MLSLAKTDQSSGYSIRTHSSSPMWTVLPVCPGGLIRLTFGIFEHPQMSVKNIREVMSSSGISFLVKCNDSYYAGFVVGSGILPSSTKLKIKTALSVLMTEHILHYLNST